MSPNCFLNLDLRVYFHFAAFIVCICRFEATINVITSLLRRKILICDLLPNIWWISNYISFLRCHSDEITLPFKVFESKWRPNSSLRLLLIASFVVSRTSMTPITWHISADLQTILHVTNFDSLSFIYLLVVYTLSSTFSSICFLILCLSWFLLSIIRYLLANIST